MATHDEIEIAGLFGLEPDLVANCSTMFEAALRQEEEDRRLFVSKVIEPWVERWAAQLEFETGHPAHGPHG